MTNDRIKLNGAVTLNCTGSLGLRLGITQNYQVGFTTVVPRLLTPALLDLLAVERTSIPVLLHTSIP